MNIRTLAIVLRAPNRMKHVRFILLGALIALLAFTAPAYTADYPTHAIHFIVPYAPGGNADIMGRLVGQRLSEALGQPVVIDNRPGANSIIGTSSWMICCAC